MSLGNVIALHEGSQGRTFTSLSAISHRRTDPDAFHESLLQELIDATPSVLPVREYLPSSNALFSLGREIPVELGAGQGFIDNLLVTNDGYLVIVETKLFRHPEGIREVIAQTLQYGMAVGQMSVMELESRIRRGMSPALAGRESIHECVDRQATQQGGMAMLAEDFEEALERHLRRGEFLLLIVSDGIHIGVERVTHWLNEQGNSSPFKFGMVELKFYRYGTDKLVIPRTVLKTREVSRHTVVVDIRPAMEVTTSAEVIDEFRTPAGGKVKESRAVKSALPPITKSQLLSLISSENLPTVTQIFDSLESAGLDQSGTATTLRFGFSHPSEEGKFIPIAYFGTGEVYLGIPQKVMNVLDDQSQQELRAKGCELGFFRPKQITQKDAPSLNAKYDHLAKNIPKFVTFLEFCRDKFMSSLLQEQGGELS